MQSQRSAPRGSRAGPPKLGAEEVFEQRMQWTLWRATRSPESVPEDLKGWAVGAVPNSNRRAFEEFVREPAGKEYTLFFPDSESARKFAEFLSNCGLMASVRGEIGEAGPDDHMRYTLGPDDNVKLVVTATALRRPRSLGRDEAAAYAKVKEGMGERKRGPDTSLDDVLEIARSRSPGQLDPLAGMKESDEPKKAAAKAVPVRRELGNEPLPQTVVDSDGDAVPLVGAKRSTIRRKLERAIETGAKFTFTVKGNARAEVFQDEDFLRRHGMDPNRVSVLQKGKREWEVTINGELKPEERDKREFERIARELAEGGRKRRPEGGS